MQSPPWGTSAQVSSDSTSSETSISSNTRSQERLFAGLGPRIRQLEFVIAEEGITAAAYMVISIVGDTWMIEECGTAMPQAHAWVPSSRR